MVKVVGHRGAAGLEPENTLRSIRRALDLGVDEVEVDLHLSQDGHLIVIHDERANRTTDGKGLVQDMTIDELKKLDAGGGERIPTLSEVIDLVGGRAVLQVELKAPGTEAKVIEDIRQGDAEKWTEVISFSHPLVKKVKDLNPRLETGVLFTGTPIYPARMALEAKASRIHPYFYLTDKNMVDDAHLSGLKVCVWTVNNPGDMSMMVDVGVDFIVTDRPDLLIELLTERGLR